MKRTALELTFVFALLISLIFVVQSAKSISKTIVVPDDYPLIQDAIDNAADGDTIFVRSGVYYETLVINKSLTLIGEDREHTIIDAHKITQDVVYITVDGVTFSNFTLGHTGYIYSSGATSPSGIRLESSYNHVTNNTIISVNGPAFRLGWDEANENIISNNDVIDCSFVAFFGFNFVNNVIVDNTYPVGRSYIDDILYDKNVIERNEAVDYSGVPSPFPADISVLEGNEVMEVSRTKGASFGDLVLKDNAVLIVDNFEAKAQSLQATDNSQIILRNGAHLYVHQITGATPMRIYLMNSASLDSTDSSTVRIVCRNDSQVRARNSILYIEASDNSLVELTNCNSRVSAGGNANVTVTDSVRCTMVGMTDEAQIWVSNSYVDSEGSGYSVEDNSELWLVNSNYAPTDAHLKGESDVWLINSTFSGSRYLGLYDNSNFWVINSTWNRVHTLTFYNASSLWLINSNMTSNEGQDILFKSAAAKISYCWYLNVNVKSPEGAPLGNMTVEIYYSNGTLVDEGITDSNGHARFILARRIMQKDGDEYFVPHTIRAYGKGLQGEANVDLDSNREITVATSIYTPSPYTPSSTVLATGIAAAVIIVIVVSIGLLLYFKKRKH
jgi:hypothetical protein